MNSGGSGTRTQRLGQIVREGDAGLALVASILEPIGDRDELDPGQLETKQALAPLAACVQRESETDSVAFTTFERLLRIDRILAAEAILPVPWASTLIPALASFRLHADRQRTEERNQSRLAAQLPIVRQDRRVLWSVVVPGLAEGGAREFLDRLLRETARLRPKRVVLYLSSPTLDPWNAEMIRDLGVELTRMKIHLDVRETES